MTCGAQKSSAKHLGAKHQLASFDLTAEGNRTVITVNSKSLLLLYVAKVYVIAICGVGTDGSSG